MPAEPVVTTAPCKQERDAALFPASCFLLSSPSGRRLLFVEYLTEEPFVRQRKAREGRSSEGEGRRRGKGEVYPTLEPVDALRTLTDPAR